MLPADCRYTRHLIIGGQFSLIAAFTIGWVVVEMVISIFASFSTPKRNLFTKYPECKVLEMRCRARTAYSVGQGRF